MNEWIVPLIGLLIYLFFCPGCFVWVWLHNRTFAAGQREGKKIDIPVRTGRGARILEPITTILVLGVLLTGYGAYSSGHNGPSAGLPARGTKRTLPVKTFCKNTGKRSESYVSASPGRLPGQAPGGRDGTGGARGDAGVMA